MDTTSSDQWDYSLISLSEASASFPAGNSRKHPRFPDLYKTFPSNRSNQKFNSPTSSGPIQLNYLDVRSVGSSISENKILIHRPTSITMSKKNGQKKINVSALSAQQQAELDRVWEAYNEKCQECERLRDDLEESKSEVHMVKSLLKKQSISEEQREASSITDNERQKEIERIQMINDELKCKNHHVQDELQLQQSYYERELADRDEKCRNASDQIEQLKEKLSQKDKQQIEILRDLEQQRDSAIRTVQKQLAISKSKIVDLEEQLSQQRLRNAELESNVFQQKTGLPCTYSPFNQNDSTKTGSAKLVSMLNHLNKDLLQLKSRVNRQRNAMEKLCENPIIAETLKAFLNEEPEADSNTKRECWQPEAVADKTEVETGNSQSLFTESSFDNREVIESLTMSTETSSTLLNNTNVVCIREIHKENDSTNIHQQPSSSSKHHTDNRIYVDIEERLSKEVESVDLDKISTEATYDYPTQEEEDKDKPTAVQPPDECLLQHPPHHQFEPHMTSKWPKRPVIMKSNTHSFDILKVAPLRGEIPGPSGLSSHLPQNHPTNRPPTRATQGEKDLEEYCPVCSIVFESSTSQDHRNRHVNGHFSDPE